ncbi:hypothetical protein [Mycolicibacterium senegalense]|uniref:Uncharacterized protein n=1 Tax=Mycolicibacterium senegalense TaxID=1796 RepID=A0ABR5G1M4_9MYCO|nr:hypothetical protein [Mycolicibacterium senegalense]KLI05777.1 hypothetical protein AA982_22710 [Mycolicibacterium senegalense]KLO54061.1 hypothetical protein ABW05_23880 [Mycolicibacterium senegalense]KLO54127.1 hypothetical protein ABW05_24320 [Mycolicibacterium senegalense]
MKYELEDAETTHYSAQLPRALTIKTVQKRFVPADGAAGDVYTEELPSGRHRSFLLERITIKWELRTDRSGVQRRITAEGRTVLANGEISWLRELRLVSPAHA